MNETVISLIQLGIVLLPFLLAAFHARKRNFLAAILFVLVTPMVISGLIWCATNILTRMENIELVADINEWSLYLKFVEASYRNVLSFDNMDWLTNINNGWIYIPFAVVYVLSFAIFRKKK